MKRPRPTPRVRVLLNQAIPFPQFEVIDENDKNLGILKKEDAIALADSKELDLLCVRKDPERPLCKIVDYGKFQFLHSKKTKKAKKQSSNNVKEMRITARISPNDLAIKLKKVRGFLLSGKKVKISMRLRGREAYVKDYGKSVLESIIDQLKDVSELALSPKLLNRTYNMTIAPFSAKSAKKNVNNTNEKQKSEDENKKVGSEATEKDSNEQMSSPKSKHIAPSGQ